MDLFELLKSQVSESAIASLAASLGETPNATRKAVLSGAAPAIVAGIVQNYSQEGGSERLLEILKSGRHDGALFDNLGAVLGGGAQTDTLVSLGKGLSGALLGDKVDAVADLVAGFAGVRRSSASSLLSLAAPLVLAALGRLSAGTPGGLSASGVAGLVSAAKAALATQAPPGLAATLGLADLSALATTPERKGPRYPWLLVPAVALLLFFVLRSCSQAPPEPIPASQGQVVAPIPPE